MIILYPFTAAVIDRPIPVFPDVGSIKISPGFNFPSRSPSRIILRPILSFTEPPGFRYSHLATIDSYIPKRLTKLALDALILDDVVDPDHRSVSDAVSDIVLDLLCEVSDFVVMWIGSVLLALFVVKWTNLVQTFAFHDIVDVLVVYHM